MRFRDFAMLNLVFEFLVLGSWFLVLGSWFLVLGSGFWVLGSWFWVLGSGFWALSGFRYARFGFWYRPVPYLSARLLVSPSPSPPISKSPLDSSPRPSFFCVSMRLRWEQPGQHPCHRWQVVYSHGDIPSAV